MLDSSFTPRPNKIRFRVATVFCWMEGDLSTVHRRLVDALNNEQLGAFVVENVSLIGENDSNFGGYEPGSLANLNSSTFLFAIPMEEKTATPAQKDPSLWVKKRPQKVRVGLGPYEVTGDTYLHQEFPVRDILAVSRAPFLPLVNCTLKRFDNASYRQNHEIILVNRNRLDFVLSVRSPEERT